MDAVGKGGLQMSMSGVYDTTKFIEANQADLRAIKNSYGNPTTLSATLTGTARYNSSMVFDSTNNLLYIYGSWNGTANVDDLVKYDLTAGTATTLSTAATGTIRGFTSMEFDAVNNLLYIYGGYSGAILDDLIKVYLTKLTEIVNAKIIMPRIK